MVKGKKIKEINPIQGILSTLSTIAKYQTNPFRESNKVFRTEEKDWLVDTCIAHDTEAWETGISKNKGEDYTIVEQYENEKEAEKGHKKWVEMMRENPNSELEDIEVWGV